MENPQPINHLKSGDFDKRKCYKIETWIQIIINGTPIGYEVSNHGSVRDIFTKKSRPANEYGKKGYQKYLSVSLPVDGRYKNYPIHRLVAMSFIPNPENKPQVNHKDTDKQNNYDWNLEWSTQKENINHAIKAGVMTVPGKGIDGRNVKNSEENVHLVCQLLEKKIPIKEIMKKVGVTNAFIIGIKYGGNWEEIRSQYKIPLSNPYGERTEQQIDEINNLLHNGYRDKKVILKSVGLPDTKTHRRYIKYRLAQMVKGSTTIESSDYLPGITFQYVPKMGMVGLVEYSPS